MIFVLVAVTKKDDHNPDSSRYNKPFCPSSGFKTTFLQYGSDI